MSDYTDIPVEFTNPNSGWKKLISRSELYVSIKDPSDICLFDATTGFLKMGIAEAGVKRLFNRDELAEFYRNRVRMVEFYYNPHAPGPMTFSPEGGELFNLYKPPFWKKDSYFFQRGLPPAPKALSELYDKYFTHLVNGDAASLTYLLDWLSNALVSRNFTILCAIGAPGIGKGRLGDIMEALVGDENFSKVRDSVFKKQFNAPLRNKQIVYVDEVAISTDEEADRIKDVVNSKIEIEAKGRDAELLENHASFYLTSNRMDAIKIDANDRRFSIIQLTDTSLLKVLTRPEVEALTKPENIQELAAYLMHRVRTSDLLFPFRSGRYHDILEAGLSEWELYLAEEFFPKKIVGSELSLDELKLAVTNKFEFLKRPPGRHKLELFVKKYPQFLSYSKSNGKRRVSIVKPFQVPA